MTKTLIRKQLMELFSFFWQDKKKNKNRTGIQFVLFLFLYIFVLFGSVFAVSYFVANMLCEPLVKAGMGWLYFVITGLMGIALGAFGSVFNTYASLYQAKDNEMLLSMPIKPGRILQTRLIGVYAMGLMYELLVMIPVLIKYYMVALPGVNGVIGTVFMTLLLSVFILVLSAVLGFGVALISSSAKYKSFVTVVLSLCFFAAYYYLYGKVAILLQEILANPRSAGEFLEGKFSPLYHMGRAATGDVISMLVVACIVLALFFAVYGVLAKSYLKIVTKNKGTAKKEYKEKKGMVRSVEKALFYKEFRRFVSSANYMLNCGLGVVFMLLVAIALLWKADTIAPLMSSVFGGQEGFVALIAVAGVAMISSMNDITAPSVSLEGKTIWLSKVLPIPGKKILMAKLKLHLRFTVLPAIVLIAAILYVFRMSPIYSVLVLIVSFLFILMMALFGLVINLNMPNLTWTSEIVPIKQSMGVMIALFGGWAVVVALGGLYVLIANFVEPVIYLIMIATILFVASMIMLKWVRTRGSEIFEAL